VPLGIWTREGWEFRPLLLVSRTVEDHVTPLLPSIPVLYAISKLESPLYLLVCHASHTVPLLACSAPGSILVAGSSTTIATGLDQLTLARAGSTWRSIDPSARNRKTETVTFFIDLVPL